jgi:hypothetical protein
MWQQIKEQLSFAWSHRTKIAGYAGVLTGAIQMYLPQASVFLTVKQMAATTMLVGAAAALIGHYNDWARRNGSQV